MLRRIAEMPAYMLRSFGYDENTEHWLERDEEVPDFDSLVRQVAGEVVRKLLPEYEDHNSRQEDRSDPIPWWSDVIDGVVKVLCEDHGFRMIEPVGIFEERWSSSYRKFCPEMDK